MTNKYGNRPAEYLGIRFKSMLEMRYAQELELRRSAEDVKERVESWAYEIPFYLPTIRPRRYVRHVVDFWVLWGDGRDCLVEVKGMETPTGKVKRLWLENYVGPIAVKERIGG